MIARRIALLLDIGFGTLEGSARSAARMAAHLQARGFTCTTLRGPEVVRERIRAELAGLRRQLGEGDGFVLYFVGHGDKLRGPRGTSTTDAPPPTTDVLLLITHDIFLADDPPRPGVAGVELIEWLTPIAEATGDVTIILDCCHAAGLTAGTAPVDAAARAHVDDVLARSLPELRVKFGVPAPRSDASEAAIVRLVATTQNEYAVERVTSDGRIGLFTDALVDALEAHPDDDLSWDELMPELQERTLAECETQRPGVEGARHRLPFSRRERPPLDEYPCRATRSGWQLQAGTLHGVELGDRFALGPATAIATEVHADGAQLELEAPADPPALVRARRISCARRHTIVWPAPLPPPPDIPELALDRDAPLATIEVDDTRPRTGNEPLATVEVDDAGLRLRTAAGLILHAEPDAGPRALARLLATTRRLARWQRQSAVLTDLAAVAMLRCEWGRVGSDEPLPDHGAELHEGDRLWVRVWGSGERPEVFASLFHLRADLRLAHLTADLDHGATVARNRSTDLTCPPGGEPRPVQLSWCEHVPRDQPRAEALVLLASGRARSFHRVATATTLAPDEPTPSIPRGAPDPNAIGALVLSYTLIPAKS